MSYPFEVALDELGRVDYFRPAGSEDTTIDPENMSQYLDGGERVLVDDEGEYDITETGGLIHPEVEVPHTVVLGSGVRIDDGSQFWTEDSGTTDIKIGRRSRIVGTELHEKVSIGAFCVVSAARIGPNTSVGDRTKVGAHSVIGADTRIASDVSIGERVKMQACVLILPDVIVESGVKIGPDTRILTGAKIGHKAKIGMDRAQRPRGLNQGGTLIRAGKVVELLKIR